MFDKECYLEKALTLYNTTVNTIDTASLIPNVNHVSGDTIFLDTLSYNRCKNLLHTISVTLGNYTLHNYYMFASDLMIKYKFESFGIYIVMQCDEPKIAIKSLGCGKCRIVETTETSKSVVCDI